MAKPPRAAVSKPPFPPAPSATSNPSTCLRSSGTARSCRSWWKPPIAIRARVRRATSSATSIAPSRMPGCFACLTTTPNSPRPCRRENPDRLRMQKTLTIVLALACGLNPDISQAQTSEEPLEEIIVTGEYAGPGMWQVTHPDHTGHTLWIVGEPPLLPKGMQFRSQQVTHVASQSQEILVQTGLSLKPDEKVGVFRILTLVPAAMKLRKNPDKATLQDLIPPDIYVRWLVQKKLYLGRDSGVEKMRPFLVAEKLHDAAIKELQVGYSGSWPEVWEHVRTKKIPVTTPTLEFTFKTDDLRGQIKAFSREKLADEECFARTVELTE